MSYFVASLVRSASHWSVDEADLADCESDLVEIGAAPEDEADDDLVADDVPVVDPVVELAVDLVVDAPPVHDSAPFGDADIVEDLGTAAAALIALCEHEGTLPVDVLVAVCAAAGCGEEFEELRG
jgi:hypothetical protein